MGHTTEPVKPNWGTEDLVKLEPNRLDNSQRTKTTRGGAKPRRKTACASKTKARDNMSQLNQGDM